ncbi:MAG: protein kinase, partial [Anaerolineae bacterium]|nr:protein kinase [Anaerolineae bacterium]
MADTLAPGTVLHGRYHIEEMLQSGAHGAIYLGTDAQAAAKAVIVHEGLDPSPEAQARFEEEARVLSSLEHPALPVVIDHFVEESGQQYLITERVEGVTLEQVLTQTGPMPEADVLSWCDRLLSALEYLHARRPPVIHGRISPPNIVIAPDGTPRLLGLLSVGEVAPDEEGRAPDADDAFAAPEQATGSYDRAADIYGVGATLYAALT